jgi:hypothetical protein
MTSAITPKFNELRGDFALRNITKGETVFTPVFTAASAALNLAVNTEKIPSTGNKRGTAFAFEKDRAGKLTINAQSRHIYMLMNQLMAGSMSRAASIAPVTFTYPVLAVGQIYQLPAKNISSVTITGKVEGTDFEVFEKSGWITALTANTTAIETGAYENGAYEELGVFSEDAQHFEILFSSEVSGFSSCFYDGLFTPSGDLALIAQSGIGDVQCVFELVEKTGAITDAVLGKYGRAYMA